MQLHEAVRSRLQEASRPGLKKLKMEFSYTATVPNNAVTTHIHETGPDPSPVLPRGLPALPAYSTTLAIPRASKDGAWLG